MFFMLAIGCGVSYYMLGYATHMAGNVIVHAAYRSEIIRNILRKPVSFFDAEDNSPRTLTSRLIGDPKQLEGLMGPENALGFVAAFNILGCVILSFYYGWKLALVGVLVIFPVVILAGYFRFKLEMEFEELNAAVFEESSQFATEAVGAFRTVTNLIMEDAVNARYAKLLSTHVARTTRRTFPSTIVFAISDSIDMLCQALIFWYGGRLLLNFEENVTSFFIVYMSVIQCSQAAGMLFSFTPNLAHANASVNRIISLRPTKAEHEEPLPPPFEEGRDNKAVSIEFKDVHFTYKSREIPVPTALSFKVESGQFGALVGAGGCGKPTVISLLERFNDPDSGSILCSGQNITTLNAHSYRSNVSLVAQESTLYEGTIKENVALSVEEDLATDEAIQEACRDAQIHDFIASLPSGYATNIGPKGLQLSGGQRQRIALARALLQKPRLLLLDEATSSLDSESEKLVQQAIERAAGDIGRTVIAVAHRLTTIQNADVIFVLGSGRVLEQGNHAELLAKRGMYWQMVSIALPMSRSYQETNRIIV